MTRAPTICQNPGAAATPTDAIANAASPATYSRFVPNMSASRPHTTVPLANGIRYAVTTHERSSAGTAKSA
jgi:hypothetical protein